MDVRRGRNAGWVWVPGESRRAGSKPKPPPEVAEMGK